MAVSTNHKTVLITGASTGIGYELALLAAQDGHHLVLIARNHERLHELAERWSGQHKIIVDVIAQDLSEPQAAEKIVAALQKEKITVDVLINNAGFGVSGLFHDTDWKATADMLQVNMVALTRLTQLLLPDMLARKSGKILNVASTAGFLPGPLMACYYASKAYVISFTEALANELAGSGVTITALCPGPTQTEFQKRAGVDRSRLFKSSNVMSAAEVAKVGYRAMRRGQTLAIAGFFNAVGMQLLRISPRKLNAAIVRHIQENA